MFLNYCIAYNKNCKAFAKNSLKYIPVIGCAWWFGEFLFLQRDLVKDKHMLETELSKLFDHGNPVTVIFTFNKNVHFGDL